METNILATTGGVIDKIFVSQGQQVEADELIARMREEKEEE